MRRSTQTGPQMRGAATLLTSSRILLSPLLVALVYVDTDYARMAMVAIVSWIWFSDLLDGRIARWTEGTTARGAVLDPIADDVAFIAGFVALLEVDLVPLWFVALALWSRSAVVLIRLYGAVRGDPYAKPLWSTRAKGTALGIGQIVLFSIHMFDSDVSRSGSTVVSDVVVGAMALAVIVGMVHFAIFVHREAVLEIFRPARHGDEPQ